LIVSASVADGALNWAVEGCIWFVLWYLALFTSRPKGCVRSLVRDWAGAIGRVGSVEILSSDEGLLRSDCNDSKLIGLEIAAVSEVGIGLFLQ
jgi:hypothetical protein